MSDTFLDENTSDNILTKQNDSDKEYFEIRDGVVVFRDYDAYIAVREENNDFVSMVNTRSLEHFKSLETIYNNIHERIWDFGEEEEQDVLNYISANEKYVFLQDYDEESRELINRTDISQNKYANENFIYKIGEETIDVREIEANLLEDYPNKMNCGSEIKAEVINNKSGCKRDRKGKIKVKAIREPNMSPFTRDCLGEIQVKLSGQRKRVCIWINYRTALDFLNTPSSATAIYPPLEGLTTPSTIIGPTWTGSTSCNECYSIEQFATNTNGGSVGCRGAYFLSAADIQGTTRGINGAIIYANCE